MKAWPRNFDERLNYCSVRHHPNFSRQVCLIIPKCVVVWKNIRRLCLLGASSIIFKNAVWSNSLYQHENHHHHSREIKLMFCALSSKKMSDVCASSSQNYRLKSRLKKHPTFVPACFIIQNLKFKLVTYKFFRK